MIDIQHDSPVPIHEQIASQLMANIASGAIKAGAKLAEYRAFAQQLLTNPQVVARAFAELEAEGIFKKDAAGGMEVTAGAAVISRVRLQDTACERLRAAVAQAMTWDLGETDIIKVVEQALAAAQARPLSGAELQSAFKKPSHATSHRDSQGFQVLPRQEGRGPAQPEDPRGGDLRPSRG